MLIYDEPFSEYLCSPAVGSSQVRNFLRSPQLFLDGRNGIFRPTSKSMDFGTAFHCALLEPERFEKTYAIAPEGLKLSTKAGIAWKAEHAEHGRLNWIDGQRIKLMVARCPREILDLVRSGRSEVTSRIDALGVPWQCRPDVLSVEWKVDVKTIQSLESITTHIWRYRYDVQESFYDWVLGHEGIERKSCFVFAETTPPHRWARVRLEADYRSRADCDVETATEGIAALWDTMQVEPEWRDIYEPLPDWAAGEITFGDEEEDDGPV